MQVADLSPDRTFCRLYLDRPAFLHSGSLLYLRQSYSRSLQGQPFSGRRASCLSKAQRGRREKDYVEFDDESEFSTGNFSLDFLPAASGQVLRTLQTLTDRFVDVIYDLFPAGTSRSVVETTTKGGLLLVTLAFASSILSFLLNAGFVVLGLYVAAKVFQVDIGGISGRQNNNEDVSGNNANPSVPPRRSKPRRKYRTDAGQAVSDLTDVWFERKPRKQAK